MSSFISLLLFIGLGYSDGTELTQIERAETRQAFAIDIEIATETSRESFRVMTPSGLAAEITMAPLDRTADGLSGTLSLRPEAMGKGLVEIAFEWTPASGRNSTQFSMRMLEEEPSSIAAVSSDGQSFEVGVVAASANPLQLATLFGSSVVEGQQSRSANCGYQTCGGSTWACCGYCALCDVGCGWLGPVCQVP